MNSKLLQYLVFGLYFKAVVLLIGFLWLIQNGQYALSFIAYFLFSFTVLLLVVVDYFQWNHAN